MHQSEASLGSQMMTGAPSVVQETRGATSHLREGFAIEVKLGRVPWHPDFSDVLADGMIFQHILSYLYIHIHLRYFFHIKTYFVYSITQGLGKKLNLVSRVHIPHFPLDTYVYICTLYL